MNLKVEHGQLLKPYSLPWSPDGWVILKGWTPDRTPEMTKRFNALQAGQPDAAQFALWLKVETDEGQRLQVVRRPWLGWVMVPSPFSAAATKRDKRISKAYRQLYSELNVEYSEFVDVGLRPSKGVELKQVPDGRYVFRGGRMVVQ